MKFLAHTTLKIILQVQSSDSKILKTQTLPKIHINQIKGLMIIYVPSCSMSHDSLAWSCHISPVTIVGIIIQFKAFKFRQILIVFVEMPQVVLERHFPACLYSKPN